MANVPVLAFQSKQLDTSDPASCSVRADVQQVALMKLTHLDGTVAAAATTIAVGPTNAQYIDNTYRPYNKVLGDTQ